MFKKEKLYIKIDGDIVGSTFSKESWQYVGFETGKGIKYYELDLSKLQEVDMELIIKNTE